MRRLWLGVAVAVLAAPLPAAARTDAKPVVGVLHTGASGRISGTSQYFSYGVVLRNTSTKDAFGVKVRVFVLGDAGLVGVYLTTLPFTRRALHRAHRGRLVPQVERRSGRDERDRRQIHADEAGVTEDEHAHLHPERVLRRRVAQDDAVAEVLVHPADPP